MISDTNDLEQLKLLCAVLLSKFGGRVRVTAAEVEAVKGKAVRIRPANEKGDEAFVSYEEESGPSVARPKWADKNLAIEEIGRVR